MTIFSEGNSFHGQLSFLKSILIKAVSLMDINSMAIFSSFYSHFFSEGYSVYSHFSKGYSFLAYFS